MKNKQYNNTIEYEYSIFLLRVSALFEKQRFLHVLEGLIGLSMLRKPHGGSTGTFRGP